MCVRLSVRAWWCTLACHHTYPNSFIHSHICMHFRYTLTHTCLHSHLPKLFHSLSHVYPLQIQTLSLTLTCISTSDTNSFINSHMYIHFRYKAYVDTRGELFPGQPVGTCEQPINISILSNLRIVLNQIGRIDSSQSGSDLTF